MLGINRELDVVADANLGVAGHRPAVRIGQRNLALAGPFKLRQQRAEPIALAADRLDLFGEVVHARTAARAAFRDIALVQPAQIIG